MAFLEFFRAAAWAGIIAADIFQGIAQRLLAVIAVRAVYVALVSVGVVMLGMVAVRTVDVGFVVHGALLRNKIARNYLAISCYVHVAAKQ